MALLPYGFSSVGFVPEIFAQSERSLQFSDEDSRWMQRAFEVSMRGVGHTAPNPTVGCVLVKDGIELAQGWTQPYGGQHAEVHVLQNLQDLSVAKGSTAYVTLEPCAHYGKTPPCVDALIAAGIRRCVIALTDPNPQVSGKSIEQLRARGIEVTVDVLRNVALAWHQPFLTDIVKDKLFVAVKWAQTIDGCLCDDNGNSRWISGKNALRYAHWLRQRYDAVLVSSKTFIHDQARLTVREVPTWINPRDPIKILLDLNHRLTEVNFEDITGKYIVIGGNQLDPLLNSDKRLSISAEGLSGLNDVYTRLRRADVTKFVGKPLQSLLVEAGPNLLASVLETRAFDRLHVIISSKRLGAKALNLSQLTPQRAIEDATNNLNLIANTALFPDLLAEYGE